MEHILNRLKQVLSVVNLDIEFVFDSIVHKNASLDAEVVVLIIPVSLERDRDSIPTVWIDVSQTVTANLDDALGHHVRLLIQMDMVLVWVVERTHGTD